MSDIWINYDPSSMLFLLLLITAPLWPLGLVALADMPAFVKLRQRSRSSRGLWARLADIGYQGRL